MTSILFVCLGNICRSPAGQAILEKLAEERNLDVEIASCGLSDWHTGELPDSRMRRAARKRGLKLASVAQEMRPAFFKRFDYILAADNAVLSELHKMAQGQKVKGTLCLVTAYSKAYPDQEIPDPYLGTEEDFELALDMLEESCACLLDQFSS